MIERIFNIPGLNVYFALLGIIIAAGVHLASAKKASRSTKIEIVLTSKKHNPTLHPQLEWQL